MRIDCVVLQIVVVGRVMECIEGSALFLKYFKTGFH